MSGLVTNVHKLFLFSIRLTARPICDKAKKGSHETHQISCQIRNERPLVKLIFRIQTLVNTNTNVKVLSNGTVFWTTPIDVSVTCNYHFRDNLWNCPLHFGSWSYTGTMFFSASKATYAYICWITFHVEKFQIVAIQKIIKVKTELRLKMYNVFVHSHRSVRNGMANVF